MLTFHILTIFPGIFRGVFEESMLRIASEKGLVNTVLHNIRDWTQDKHRKVDDEPFGGGPGMVMKVGPIVRAVCSVRKRIAPRHDRLVLLTPDGELFNQRIAREFVTASDIILICGRYEGVDERVRDILRPEEVSVGEFILTGGEIPAMIVVDAVTRLVPGVLGCAESAELESFEGDYFDYPHYTRPVEFEGHAVPDVLRGGNHAEIAKWRDEKARERTMRRRRSE